MANINRVVIEGNLTRDPELRQLAGGNSVCKLRVAVNDRRKVNGEWQDVPGYYDVTSWGAQGESCAKYLAKGSQVAVDGRLEWREWTTDDGQKRQAVEISASDVQFLGSRSSGDGGPAASASTSTEDDSIPF